MNMVVDGNALSELAHVYGIQPDYEDVWKKRHIVSQETQRSILSAMGVRVDCDQAIIEALDAEINRSWQELLPPVLVKKCSESPLTVTITLLRTELNRPFIWELHTEQGEEYQGNGKIADLLLLQQKTIQGRCYYRLQLSTGIQLKPGYHQFILTIEGQQAVLPLIIFPNACYRPDALAEGRRTWGWATQLYSLRSMRNWGIGDFTDLRTLADQSAELGADLIGLNPLHSLFPSCANRCSPYSPSSRLFLNILYIDLEKIAEFSECSDAQAIIQTPLFKTELHQLRNCELVNYEAVANLKLPVLEMLYKTFQQRHLDANDQRAVSFQNFQQDGADYLHSFALYEALLESIPLSSSQRCDWRDWPAKYQDPYSAAVTEFAESHVERINFYQYLQWQAYEQLEETGQHIHELNLGIGIYQDLAVSVDPGGADAWAHQALFSIGAAIGCPPDLYNLKGQTWNLPPPIPQQLIDSGYRYFIAMLRSNMRNADALRIDHVMGLLRLFWVPDGATPADGAYVHYPLDDLLGIIALESQRNHCMVIGEDLGTVPPELQQSLTPMDILSYRVMYFEKNDVGQFSPPDQYPARALVSVSTHDLPTLAGFWEGLDIELRYRLELFPTPESYTEQVIARGTDRALMLAALNHEQLLPTDVTLDPAQQPLMSEALCRAVHRYVARTPCDLMLIQPEDVLGQRDAINLPGTVDQHPNWRRKLPIMLEEFRSSPVLRELVKDIRQERQQNHDRPELAPGKSSMLKTATIPRCTYRLQFNQGFRFRDATALIPYLHDLGISHCYASPYLKARAGSMHGYDIIDHNLLNPEIGDSRDFEEFVSALLRHNMGQILDIVPNHMGALGSDNAWWLDVLENGEVSIFAPYFDIAWKPLKTALRGKVLLPVLGDHYGEVLENGELVLKFNQDTGEFSFDYYEHSFPVDPSQYPLILRRHLPVQNIMQDSGNNTCQTDLQSLIAAFEHLPQRANSTHEQVQERHRDKQIHKRRLAELCNVCPEVHLLIQHNVDEYNDNTRGDAYRLDLHELLEAQAYRLAYWRVAANEINYRRFFDINELAGLNMEDEQVFASTHKLILQLVQEGKITGLRIDHPDGLSDPAQYYRRLCDSVTALSTTDANSRSVYLVVEKILASYEHLPNDWCVHGTSGYDFTNLVNGLFINSAAEQPLTRAYQQFTGSKQIFDDLLYSRKKQIMRVSLSSELQVLSTLLSDIAEANLKTRDYTYLSLRDALIEVVACFPVYRSYITAESMTDQDQQFIGWAVTQAKNRSETADFSIFDFIHAVLLLKLQQNEDADYRQKLVNFTMKFQQFTSPVMAKGLEDTTFYNYHRLISHNEVGGDPRRFAVSVSAFHYLNDERAKHWPHSMLATTTHDTKRSEDVRARINVLSEIPAQWKQSVSRWTRLNRSRKRRFDGNSAPSKNDEYLLYQILIGSWPLRMETDVEKKDYLERITAYMLKAIREAKTYTSWVQPNDTYEQALNEFVTSLLDDKKGRQFLENFISFTKPISRVGLYNSVSMCLLKLTVPGVPDIYQGNELWDFSLVDPDNRRPVDYNHRRKLLDALSDYDDDKRASLARELVETIEDGRIKLYVVWKTLRLRQRYEALFCDGDYEALTITGKYSEHICAFARSTAEQMVIVIAPRLLFNLTEGGVHPPLGQIWENTRVELPEKLKIKKPLFNIYCGSKISTHKFNAAHSIKIADALQHFPLAVLTTEFA